MKKKILFKSFFVLMFSMIALFLVFGLVRADGATTFKAEFNDKEFKIVTEGITDPLKIEKDKEVTFEVKVPEKKEINEVKANDVKQEVKDKKFTLKFDKDYKLTVTFKDAVAPKAPEKLKPIQIAAIVVLVISILIPAIMALVKKIQNKKAEQKMMQENLTTEENAETSEAVVEEANAQEASQTPEEKQE